MKSHLNFVNNQWLALESGKSLEDDAAGGHALLSVERSPMLRHLKIDQDQHVA